MFLTGNALCNLNYIMYLCYSLPIWRNYYCENASVRQYLLNFWVL